MKISFIGGGVMAEALIKGILEAGIAAPSAIKVGEPDKDRRNHLAEEHCIEVASVNADAMNGSDLVVLSVKPQIIQPVMKELQSQVQPEQTVMSIVAGAKISTLIDGLSHPSIVRVMPNTPAQIGAGMTVWTTSNDVQDTAKSVVRDILTTLGKEIYVNDEKLLDAATALSASGPAYVFLFIEALIDAGVYMGMQRDVARELVLQTVSGSTRLVEDSGLHPGHLKDMVSSPGGGTVEALKSFEKSGFRGAVLEAVNSAYKKYQELGDSD